MNRLREGVSSWNKWRERTPNIVPELSHADLHHAELSVCNLSKADLSHADLSRANLSRADLRGATLIYAELNRTDMINADLVKANLYGAKLNNANLSGTDLSGAKFRSAELFGANFTHAILTDTDFDQAKVGATIFADLDLSKTINLDTVRYVGPSTIGIDTLYKSDGNIPREFLIGCGVPQKFIPLSQQPSEFYNCFISYSHKDKSFARRLHDSLQGRGIRCWLDEYQLLPGDDIYERVNHAIRGWDKVLLCCSEASLNSWWVDNEINTAFDKEQKLMEKHGKRTLALIPLNLDGYLFKWESGKATQVKARLAADFTGWKRSNTRFERELERLIRALRTDGGGREPAPQPKL